MSDHIINGHKVPREEWDRFVAVLEESGKKTEEIARDGDITADEFDHFVDGDVGKNFPAASYGGLSDFQARYGLPISRNPILTPQQSLPEPTFLSPSWFERNWRLVLVADVALLIGALFASRHLQDRIMSAWGAPEYRKDNKNRIEDFNPDDRQLWSIRDRGVGLNTLIAKREVTYQQIRFPKGTRFYFRDGILSDAAVKRPADGSGRQPGDNIMDFYENGRPRYIQLPLEQEIQGIPYPVNSALVFDESGRIINSYAAEAVAESLPADAATAPFDTFLDSIGLDKAERDNIAPGELGEAIVLRLSVTNSHPSVQQELVLLEKLMNRNPHLFPNHDELAKLVVTERASGIVSADRAARPMAEILGEYVQKTSLKEEERRELVEAARMIDGKVEGVRRKEEKERREREREGK